MDPATIALSVLSTVVTAAGQKAESDAYAAQQQAAANAARQQAQINANIQRQQAQQVLANQQIQEAQERKVNKAAISAQLAQIGKSGIELSGTPMGLVQRSVAEQELSLLNDKYNAEIQAYNIESGATVTQFTGEQEALARESQAQTAKSQGKRRVVGTLLSGTA